MATRVSSPPREVRNGLKIRVQTVRLCPWAHPQKADKALRKIARDFLEGRITEAQGLRRAARLDL